MSTVTNLNVPEEVKKLNWGAFFLSWLWGIFNNTFIALIVFVPFVGWVMPFVLLFKGSEWAWKNKEWASVEQFLSVQKKWAIAGLIFFIANIVISVLGLVLFFSMQAAVSQVQMMQN